MIGRDFKFHNGQKGAALAIRMVTGRKKDRIKKVHKDGTVVVELSGKAGESREKLLQYLAAELDIEIARIDIIEGKEGKDLLLSILDVSPEDLQHRILTKID